VLAAIFLGRGEGRPSGRDELVVSLLETGRSGDRTVVVALAADFVTDLVQWLKHFLAELSCLLEDCGDEVGRGVGEAGEVGITADVENLVEDEARFFHRRVVDRHVFASSLPRCQYRPILQPTPRKARASAGHVGTYIRRQG